MANKIEEKRRMSRDKQQTFTVEQLAQRWNCSVDEVKGYIRSGKLRRAFDTTKAEHAHLRDLDYYKCEADEQLLNAIQNGKPLSEFVSPVVEENFIPCPDYLYVPIEDNATIDGPDKEHKMLRYFYALDGDVLIPIKRDSANSPVVKH